MGGSNLKPERLPPSPAITHPLSLSHTHTPIAGVAMFICNFEPFGYIIRPQTYPSLKIAAERFTDFKIKTLGMYIHIILHLQNFPYSCSFSAVNFPPVQYSQFLPRRTKDKSNMGLDAVELTAHHFIHTLYSQESVSPTTGVYDRSCEETREKKQDDCLSRRASF